jgi:hypothetical protein
MPGTDFFEDVLFLFAVVTSQYAPASNVNGVRFGQLVPKVLPVTRRFRFTLCPQGRCAFSTHSNVVMLCGRRVYQEMTRSFLKSSLVR